MCNKLWDVVAGATFIYLVLRGAPLGVGVRRG